MHARRDERGDVRIESDAGDIEEHVIAELARIDDASCRAHRALDRLRRIERNAQIAREAVARAAGNDPQCRRGRSRIVALHERASHFVDRAVAAPRHDEICARRRRLERELVRMAGALRQANLPFTPSRSSVRVATSTRSAPVPRRLGPETGLMMMTTRRHNRETSRNPFGRA